MNKTSLCPQYWTEALAGVALLLLISGFIGLGPNPVIAQGDLDALSSEAATAGSIERTARLTPAVPTSCSQSWITCGILFALNWLVDMVISIVYPLVEQLFTAMLSENLTAFANGRALIAAEVGWRIVLGIVNMFFVLLLLWIAIATIFDFSMFSARNLLPKLIIMALLINFSFAIGKSIINLSNGIGNIFYEQIKRQGGPAAAVKKMFDMKTMTMAIQNQYVSLSPEEARQKLIDARVTLQRGITPLGIIDIPLGFRTEWTALDCYNEVYALPSVLGGLAYLSQAWIFQEWTYNQCNALLKNVEISQALVAIDPTIGSEILLAGAFIAKAFMVPIVLFVLFAGAIMFLVRLISLMGLLIFAPFAFLSFIIPGMGNFWSGWWSRLFKWSFFLPAFLFLFMLSLLVVQGIPIETQRAILAGQAVPNLSRLMLDYAIGIGLMIFALLVGNQMAIYGAGAVVGVGRRWSKATGGWAKRGAGRTALRFAAPAAKRLEEGTGALARTLKAIPGVTRATQITAAAQRRTVAKREGTIDKYSNDELKRLIAMRGTTTNTRAAALNILQKRNDLREVPAIPGFNAAQIRGIAETMRNVGTDIRAIERSRPDIAIPRPGETQEQATRRVAGETRPVDLENMEESVVLHPTLGHYATQGIVDRAGPAHMQKIIERGGIFSDEIVHAIEALDATGARSSALIAAELRRINPATGRARNENLARFIESDLAGRNLLNLAP